MLGRMTGAPIEPASRRPPVPATIADWLAIPETRRAELIHGRIVYYAMPGPTHGMTQGRLFGLIEARYGRRGGDAERPGGWWLSQEVDLESCGFGCRPDLVGWTREKHPRMPVSDKRGVVTDVPDWICEVLSPSTARYDLGPKRDAYQRAGVPWYWLADPQNRTLTVLRNSEAGYVVTVTGGLGDMLRAKPFEAAEVDLDAVFDFGDEPIIDP